MPFQIQTIEPDDFGGVIVTLQRIDAAGNLVLRGASVKELFGADLQVGAVVEVVVAANSQGSRLARLENTVYEMQVAGFAPLTAKLETIEKQIAAIADNLKTRM